MKVTRLLRAGHRVGCTSSKNARCLYFTANPLLIEEMEKKKKRYLFCIASHQWVRPSPSSAWAACQGPSIRARSCPLGTGAEGDLRLPAPAEFACKPRPPRLGGLSLAGHQNDLRELSEVQMPGVHPERGV